MRIQCIAKPSIVVRLGGWGGPCMGWLHGVELAGFNDLLELLKSEEKS